MQGGLFKIFCGDALSLLKQLPSGTVQTCITSPPYFNLRAYPTPPMIFGGETDCPHLWGAAIPGDAKGGSGKPNGREGRGEQYARGLDRGSYCDQCGAWQGQLGREPTPKLFVEHLGDIFEEVRRVLHPSGTLWLNIRDSQAGSGKGPSGKNGLAGQEAKQGFVNEAMIPRGYKRKDMFLVPFLLAQELQQRSWYLRQDIIWHKPNAKPESVLDRPVLDYEHVFLLSKSPNYFYDYYGSQEAGLGQERRAGRSVWSIPTATTKILAEHYATFPEALVERCLQAAAPSGGVCANCRTPWKRKLARQSSAVNPQEGARQQARSQGAQQGGTQRVTLGRTQHTEIQSLGWEEGCFCGQASSVPALVLDPFGGVMTTGAVAIKQGHNFIGLELSSKYAEAGKRRMSSVLLEKQIA